MRILVDATTAIALGTIGERELLAAVDGSIELLPEVVAEVTTEPAATNVDALFRSDASPAVREPGEIDRAYVTRAKTVLEESERNGDVRLVAEVLRARQIDQDIAVVSDDRRVRVVAEGFGATVTGTIGIVVRAVNEGLSANEGKALVRRIDRNGLHTTGELRERAYELIEDAGDR